VGRAHGKKRSARKNPLPFKGWCSIKAMIKPKRSFNKMAAKTYMKVKKIALQKVLSENK
jgi:hypothetical protein